MTIQSLLIEGELSGYTQSAPPGAGEAIDFEVCAKAFCPECGHEGMDYVPFTATNSYRAFAVCPKCGETQEF